MNMKEMGYKLGVINKDAKTGATAEQVADNMFTDIHPQKKDFILYYKLGEQASEVLADE